MMLRYQKDGISIKNKCIRISNCSNMGGTVPDETNVQRNFCINWCDFSNSGSNNYNICVHGHPVITRGMIQR